MLISLYCKTEEMTYMFEAFKEVVYQEEIFKKSGDI